MSELSDFPAPSWVRHYVAELPAVDRYPVFMSVACPEAAEDVRVICAGCDSMSPARMVDPARRVVWRHGCPNEWADQ